MWKNASGYVTGNAREKRGFSYYLHNTAPSVTSYYDSLFGDKLLVQAAASEPMLGHAMIGIGALHEAFANKQPYSNRKTTKGQFAIAQYTKAIGHLRRSLAADTGAQQPLTMLMACILFACFESIQGHSEPTLVNKTLTSRLLCLFKVDSIIAGPLTRRFQDSSSSAFKTRERRLLYDSKSCPDPYEAQQPSGLLR